MKKTLTPAQQAAKDARKVAFAAVIAKVAAMSPDERLMLARACPLVTVENRALSDRNQLLVALQIPRATIVGGFRQWLAAGRSVIKGQHGAAILVPIGCRKPEERADGEVAESVHFTTGYVFDISQTEPVADANEDSTRGHFVEVIENPAEVGLTA